MTRDPKDEIYKLQYPLFGPGDILVYKEDREHIFLEKTPEMEAFFNEHGLKVYAWCSVDEDGELSIGDVLPHSEWPHW